MIGFQKGYGYGADTNPDDPSFDGCWYPIAFKTRKKAHRECQQELSHYSADLYTQMWVSFLGWDWKVWFTRRAVTWSLKSAKKGLKRLFRIRSKSHL